MARLGDTKIFGELTVIGKAKFNNSIVVEDPTEDDHAASKGYVNDEIDNADLKEGPQGPTGPQGDTGPEGDTGPMGPQGYQGSQGDQGDQGSQGPAGSRGPQGSQGDQGSSGSIGDTGPTGPRGSQGSQGPGGPQGYQGNQGSGGSTGRTGDTGPTGPQGDTGYRGYRGDTGPRGDRGDIGPRGSRGVQGAQGPDGSQGPRGDTGPQGFTGYEGDTGPQGDTGPSSGPQGPQGYQGPTGPSSDDSSLRYKEDVEDLEDQTKNLYLVKPKRFKWKKSKKKDIGLIAEEIEKVYPEVVRYDEEGRPDKLDQNKLTSVLFDISKRQAEKIKDIKTNLKITSFTITRKKEEKITMKLPHNWSSDNTFVFVRSADVNGKGHGFVNGDELVIFCDESGKYNVLLVGVV